MLAAAAVIAAILSQSDCTGILFST